MARSGFGNQFLTKYISFVAVMSVALSLALPAGSQAGKAKPHASTGGATHLRGTTGLLTGLVFPRA